MSINNRADFLSYVLDPEGYGFAGVVDNLLSGSKIQLSPDTYIPDWDNLFVDAVSFLGTSGKDALFGGGGEVFTFFLGSRGDDLYGTAVFTESYIDYSDAPKGVVVDMTYSGSRTFTDANGVTQTVAISGKAFDGFGGTDYFAESTEDWGAGLSSILGIFGSSYRDVMINDGSDWGLFLRRRKRSADRHDNVWRGRERQADRAEQGRQLGCPSRRGRQRLALRH